MSVELDCTGCAVPIPPSEAEEFLGELLYQDCFTPLEAGVRQAVEDGRSGQENVDREQVLTALDDVDPAGDPVREKVLSDVRQLLRGEDPAAPSRGER